MTVILQGNYLTVRGEKEYQIRFDTADIYQTATGVRISWGIFYNVEIPFDTIITNLDGSEKTYANVDQMYNDYIKKRAKL
jgi:hypothetical protein